MKERLGLPRRAVLILLAAGVLALLLGPVRAEECTTAVVSGSATPDGRPLLWKNRDTGEANNKLVYIADGPLAAVALVNVGSSSSVWMGVNAAGLAIENSNSEDLEGTSGGGNGSFMRQALLNCATVADFEALLVQTNATGRTTQANYGVIDASGGAAMFEVGNHTYQRYDAADAPLGFIVRTNFAFTSCICCAVSIFGPPTDNARQYTSHKNSTSCATDSASSRPLPSAIMPWLPSRQALRSRSASSARSERFCSPKMVYGVQRMLSPPAMAMW